MEKLKKFLYVPLAYHAAIFVTMIILELLKSNVSGIMGLIDLCGVLVTPMLYATVSIVNAIVFEGKVFDFFYKSIAYIVVIGVIRIAVYAFMAPSLAVFSIGALIVSVAVFSLWEALFALTDKMMKKRSGPRGRKNRK